MYYLIIGFCPTIKHAQWMVKWPQDIEVCREYKA